MSEDDKYNKAIKVILVGESDIGKTNLVKIIRGEEFDPSLGATGSPTYTEKQIEVNNKNYLYCILDTSGYQKLRNLTKIFLNKSKIILIVFSIICRESFDEVDFWYNTTKEILGEDGYIIALVANQSDRTEGIVVKKEEIERKAKELNIKYLITSAAKDKIGFPKFLSELLEDYINQYHPEEYIDPKAKEKGKSLATSEPKTIKIKKDKTKDKNGKSNKKCNN